MNTIKLILYRAILHYYWYFPFQKGKSFLLRITYKFLGNATFKIGESYFSLCPISFIDSTLIQTNCFDGEIESIIKQVMSEGGLFLDIGANFGYYSILAAKIPSVTVLALEPSPREFERLKINISLNKRTNITALQLAAAAISGKRKLHIADNSNHGMNSFTTTANSNQSVMAACVSLDEFLDSDQNLKLIKIDVEGAEYEVLFGMQQLLHFFDGILICEISPGTDNGQTNKVEAMYNLLEMIGYKPFKGLNTSIQYDEYFYKRNADKALISALINGVNQSI